VLRGLISLCPLALTLVTSGCAGSMGTLHPPSPSPPPVTSFDGSYRNTIRVTGSFGSGKDVSGWCASPGQPIITIANGQFSYAVAHPNVPGSATATFIATMAEDGSFNGQIVAGRLWGRVTGTHIEGRIDGSACLYELSGERV
jgi:hypothetical protein